MIRKLNNLSNVLFCLTFLIFCDQANAEPLSQRQLSPLEPRTQPPQIPIPELPQKPEIIIPEIPTPPEQEEFEDKVFVKHFVIQGNTVFTDERLQSLVSQFTGREISFAELMQVRSAINQLYIDEGYVTSGAYIPPQDIKQQTIIIQVVEGQIENFNITGGLKLHSYVRSRLNAAVSTIFNVNKLYTTLATLQRNQFIELVTAELIIGTQPGKNQLNIIIKEQKPTQVDVELNNYQSSAYGSFGRSIQFTHGNLSGKWGDQFTAYYRNTEGSNAVDFSYAFPVNTQDGTLKFSVTAIFSKIVSEPFSELDIINNYQNYQVSFRQPVFRKAKPKNRSFKELAVGMFLSRSESRSELLKIPFPIFAGSDEKGQTRTNVISIFADYFYLSEQQAFQGYSQLNLGIGGLGATINPDPPDSRFFSWQFQLNWARFFKTGATFVARGGGQFADRPLNAVAQFGLGGIETIRGYPANNQVTDNGLNASLELYLPVYRGQAGQFLVAPFVDFGYGWDQQRSFAETPGTLASVGFTLLYNLSDRLLVRLDWGVPLINGSEQKNNLQDNGIYLQLKARI
jgi:hemolysin activation/secretion protein